MYYISLFLLLLSISGCINLKQKEITPSQKKQIHVKKLNKEVKKLDSHDKRLIYKSIKKEINLYNQKGNLNYKNGYYYDAINAYELVNFYESSNAIPLTKINHMKSIAKQRAFHHYKKAKAYLPTNKKKALIEFNSVMMNNPDYKETKTLYTTIKNERDMKIYLNTLQNSLETQIINNKGTFKELKAIQKSLNELEKYDYKNEAIEKARKLLSEKKDLLLKEAIAIYKQKRLKKAKKRFYNILFLYPQEITAQEYINKINFRQNKTHTLYLAKHSLEQNHYLQAQSYAKKVLQLERTNKEALDIISNAKKKSQEAVKQYIKEGKIAYNNKNLDLAKKYFEKALNINKTDNTALIYHKRIQRQLQTIKSLQ